jgi:uncharacterized damage-inducible protein DinB
MSICGVANIQHQIDILLDALNNEQYAQELAVLSNASIGKHLRHIYEFYKTIVDSALSGKIDYSLRQRNQDIEKSIPIAKSYLEQVFEKISNLDLENELLVIPEFGFENQKYEFKSSIGRELMYAFDHAVHHLAIIKIGAASLNVSLPKNFGVAPSTIKYQNQNL